MRRNDINNEIIEDLLALNMKQIAIEISCLVDQVAISITAVRHSFRDVLAGVVRSSQLF